MIIFDHMWSYVMTWDSLGGPLGTSGRPWRGLWGSSVQLWASSGSSRCPHEVLGSPQGSLGRSRRNLGILGGALGIASFLMSQAAQGGPRTASEVLGVSSGVLGERLQTPQGPSRRHLCRFKTPPGVPGGPRGSLGIFGGPAHSGPVAALSQGSAKIY